MSKGAIAARVLPVLAVAAVLALSFVGGGKVSINANLVACAGYGTGYGYTGGPPKVTSVSAALGVLGGGKSVTITGQGYCDPATAIHFGATAAPGFAITSDTTMTVNTPAHALGLVDVTVTNGIGTSGIGAGDKFDYLTSGIYTMDAYGGFHPDDSAAITGTAPAYWAGWKIARAAHPWPTAGAAQQGFTLDGYGGLHPYGPISPAFAETPATAATHYWGIDIARDFAFLPNGTGGVVLDGDGGLHGFGVNGAAAPVPQGYSYFGSDVAIKVVIASNGLGGYTLDAYGGVHPFGIGAPFAPTTPIQNTGYWTSRLAQDIVLIPGGYTGYVLDKFGGTHPLAPTGTTLPTNLTTSYFGFNIARGIAFLPGSGTDGYTLDGYGGIHPFGSAPALMQYSYFGYDIVTELFGA